MAIDLKSMSLKDLKKLMTDVEKAIQSAEKTALQEARKAAETAAAKFGFSLDEVTGGKGRGAKRAKAAAKYRNPANPDQTWSGRGRKPAWIHEALSKGADITDLEI